MSAALTPEETAWVESRAFDDSALRMLAELYKMGEAGEEAVAALLANVRPAPPRFQAIFDALPVWAQLLVRGAEGIVSYGAMGPDSLSGLATQTVQIRGDAETSLYLDGMAGLREFAAAMTAPWPPAESPERLSVITDPDAVGYDCAFDQPSAFGERLAGEGVFCRNAAWPNAPNKCHRNRSDYRHEDCAGFVPNLESKS